ncbi:unnamed protein product [Strongylus vulgaris]|uniref:Uncharacterized protein n=1 Tax=Strongylus vulgaris TaxID=40348 RepID=A0A3P7IT22_STRVU|nr:unnamed protein product [Strongylus vulgaris]
MEELKFVQSEADAERVAHEKTKAALNSKDEEVNQLSVALDAKEDEIAELQYQVDSWKGVAAQKEEANSKVEQKREEEINKLKRRHADELKNIQHQVELEQRAHTKTKQQFVEYRQSAQETWEKKMAELRE